MKPLLASGIPLAKVAARVMAGQTLAQQGVTKEIIPPYYSVKEVVLPFNKFPGVDPLLGPEMRSTGEVITSPVERISGPNSGSTPGNLLNGSTTSFTE